jgi:hypothetical protein
MHYPHNHLATEQAEWQRDVECSLRIPFSDPERLWLSEYLTSRMNLASHLDRMEVTATGDVIHVSHHGIEENDLGDHRFFSRPLLYTNFAWWMERDPKLEIAVPDVQLFNPQTLKKEDLTGEWRELTRKRVWSTYAPGMPHPIPSSLQTQLEKQGNSLRERAIRLEPERQIAEHWRGQFAVLTQLAQVHCGPLLRGIDQEIQRAAEEEARPDKWRPTNRFTLSPGQGRRCKIGEREMTVEHAVDGSAVATIVLIPGHEEERILFPLGEDLYSSERRHIVFDREQDGGVVIASDNTRPLFTRESDPTYAVI